MTTLRPGELEAACALHRDAPAVGTCDRCGNFTCRACHRPGPPDLCPTCRELVGPVGLGLQRDTWTFSALWEKCWVHFQREWLSLSVCVLLFLGVVLGIQGLSVLLGGLGTLAGAAAADGEEGGGPSLALSAVVGAGQFVLGLGGYLVQSLLELGLVRVGIDVLEGGKAEPGRMFSQAHRLWALVLQRLVTGLLVLGPVLGASLIVATLGVLVRVATGSDFLAVALGFAVGLVALAAGIYLAVPFAFLSQELVYDQQVGPVQSLRNVFSLAWDQRLSVLGVVVVCSVVQFAGAMLCCVGYLPAFGLSQLLLCGLYLTLRTA